MSQHNVAVVRRGIEAFRRGDWESIADVIDPHISIRTDTSWPEQRIYGREAALAFYRGIAESGGSDTHIEEAVDLGIAFSFACAGICVALTATSRATSATP